MKQDVIFGGPVSSLKDTDFHDLLLIVEPLLEARFDA